MSKAKPKKADASRALTIGGAPDESDARAIARATMRPTVQASMTATSFLRGDFEEVDLDELVNELAAQCALTRTGNLGRPEAILTAQAHTLDLIFNKLARLAGANMSEHLDAADRFMRLALKAQSQCRSTLETLATIKNPPMVFARQANVTSGPQQVNNGVSLAREIQTEQSRLLERTNGERLDTRAVGDAISSDPAMATAGPFDWPEDGGR